MDAGAWIAIGSLIIAGGSLIVAVISNRGNVTRSELAQIEAIKKEARTGYVDEVQAELALFRQKFADADKHMKTCEEDLRRTMQELNTLKGQHYAMLLSQLPRDPLIVRPDGEDK